MHASATPYSSLSHHHLASTPSTNSELMQWLNSGRINRDVPYMLTASTQTAGRGQYKRSWQSPIGNLYLSLYHPLAVPVSGLLSLVVGYQLTCLPIIQQLNKTLRQTGQPPIGVKWANDIGYYSTSAELSASNDNDNNDNTPLIFNKLAGILIEPVITGNAITGVIIGVGINIAITPVLNEYTKEGMDYHAISLNQLLESAQSQPSTSQINSTSQASSTPLTPKLRAEDLYLPVGASIVRAVQQFSSFHDSSYARTAFLNDYDNVSVLTGRQVVIQQRLMQSPPSAKPNTNFTSIKGIVRGIHDDGSLKLEQTNDDEESQLTKIYTGTIRVMPT